MLNGKISVNEELERMWKEAVVRKVRKASICLDIVL
jgi:hypothetical protein